jgi:steroid delta-isomerase-like uncharacterized protein
MAEHGNPHVAETIEEYAETVWNRGDTDAAGEYFAEDVVVHDVPAGTDYEGLGAFEGWVTDVRSGFPDFAVETRSVIPGDDRIASQWVATGTHDGTMSGLDVEPTGETVRWEGTTVYRVADGNVTEAWWYYDMLGMLTQLGVVPEAAAP